MVLKLISKGEMGDTAELHDHQSTIKEPFQRIPLFVLPWITCNSLIILDDAGESTHRMPDRLSN